MLNIQNNALILLIFLTVLLFISCAIEEDKPVRSQAHNPIAKTTQLAFQNGDIIFQTSNSSQSQAIQLATNSPYSHVGIIYKKQDKFWVFEAVEPVKLTPLEAWIKRGKKGHYVVKRLKNEALLSPNALKKMKALGEKYLGKHYDLYFEWSDDKIYCSELVWKIYKEAVGIELGTLETLATFDLTNPIVQKKIQERYKGKIPLNEKVISPAAIFESKQLITIKNH